MCNNTVTIFFTLTNDDAESINNLYKYKDSINTSLFNAATEVLDSDLSELEFTLSFNPSIRLFLESVINDSFDHTGIFEYLLSLVNDES